MKNLLKSSKKSLTTTTTTVTLTPTTTDTGTTGTKTDLDEKTDELQYKVSIERFDSKWKYQILKTETNKPVTWKEIIEIWKDDKKKKAFCTLFTESLPEEYGAFFWETPPITKSTLKKTFEYMIINSTALVKKKPNSTRFDNYIANGKGKNEVRVFKNLGKDATMIVPCQYGKDANVYTHFAVFLRNAPTEQIPVLWSQLASAIENTLKEDNNPHWISTAGMGVSWLHVRIDSRPKYYNHAPYKNKKYY